VATKLRIAQVNVYFNPFMVGGAEWYVHNLSRELVKMGHEVDVFTADTYNGGTASPTPSLAAPMTSYTPTTTRSLTAWTP
jgi:hypothetical protein